MSPRDEPTVAVIPDPARRLGGFLIEIAVWVVMFLFVSAIPPDLPAYADVIAAWLPYVPYKVYTLRRRGSCLGHMATDVRVADYRTGCPVSTGQAIARTLPEITYSLVIPLVVNVVVMAADPQHRQLFDRVAGTIAVRGSGETTTVQYVPEEHSDNPDETEPRPDPPDTAPPPP